MYYDFKVNVLPSTAKSYRAFASFFNKNGPPASTRNARREQPAVRLVVRTAYTLPDSLDERQRADAA